MKLITLNGILIDLDTAEQYITDHGFKDDEFILRTPEGLFIHQRNQLSKSKAPVYELATVEQVRAWLEGRAGVEFSDVETAIDELGLSRPSQDVKPVSDDTPPDDGFDFGDGDENQESVLLQVAN